MIKKKMYVYVEGDDQSLINMWDKEGWVVTDDVKAADLVCFEGGADVNPELYGAINKGSYVSAQKDFESLKLYALATRYKKPMVGICRGGQFLNVMGGGSMVQHIDGHTYGNHPIVSKDGLEKYTVNTDHHQMMVPGVDGQVLFTDENDNTIEIVVYHYEDGKPRRCPMLCFQAHPEYNDGVDTYDLFFSLVKEHLGMFKGGILESY